MQLQEQLQEQTSHYYLSILHVPHSKAVKLTRLHYHPLPATCSDMSAVATISALFDS